MAFRNIVIASPAHISVKNSQLVIRTDREHSVSPEDISALLLESRQSTISTAALSLLGQRGCTLFICDEKHLPCAVLTPFSQHSRQLSVLKEQMALGEVLKKQLWKSVVKAKIKNQALCLDICGEERTAAEGLYNMLSAVRSGDTGNMESAAAARYFPALFGRGFVRREDSGINSALNYGYAILRGQMARSLAVYGFLPALGLHHESELNQFNLADDLMEPFRPLADMMVRLSFTGEEQLTPERKRLLFNVLNMEVFSGGQRHSVAYAMERTVQSLRRSLENGKDCLMLPELTEPKQHSYE